MFGKILHTFGINVFSAVINLVVAVLLSQYLGPAGKGNQSLIITTISFILIFSNVVGGATLVYLVPRHESRLLLIPAYCWTLVMSILSYFILLFSGLIDKSYVLHVCILAIMYSVTSIHSNLLIGQQRIKLTNYLSLTQSITLILSLSISFFLLKQISIATYIAALYISIGINLVAGSFYIRKSFSGQKPLRMTEFIIVIQQMFKFGFYNQIAHITQMTSFRISFYIIEQYKGLASVGVYSNGLSIAEGIWLVAKSMSLVQYSMVANSNDRESSARFTLLLIKAGIAISILLLIPLVLMPEQFYTYIFGRGFSGVKPVIISLIPGVLIYNISILLGHYFSGTGRYYMNAGISGIGMIVSLILYFILIPRMDIYGAGFATSLSYTFTSILFMIYFSREIKPGHFYILPTIADVKILMSHIRKRK